MKDLPSRHHLDARQWLLGAEVRLRAPRPDDLPFIRTLWGDPETMAPVGGPVDLPETRAASWFARMVDPGKPSDCYCLIFDRNDEPVGEISFHKWDAGERSAEPNIKILASRRRQGLGGDALRTFLPFFFGPCGGELMIDNVARANPAGLRLMESVGFERVSETPEFTRLIMTKRGYLDSCRQFGRPPFGPETR